MEGGGDVEKNIFEIFKFPNAVVSPEGKLYVFVLCHGAIMIENMFEKL